MKKYTDAPTIKQLTEDILDDLRLMHLSEAHDNLNMLVQQAQDDQAKAELEELRHNYSAMLDFLMQGGEDSNRTRIQADIASRTWTLLIKTLRTVRLAGSDDHYTRAFTRIKKQRITPRKLMKQWAATLPSEERYDLQDTLFDLIWTSPLWTEKDAMLWNDFILRQDVQVQQHLTWAIFLSSWEFPDPKKVHSLTLFSACYEDDVCMAAITALVLLHQHYGRDLEMFAGLIPITSDNFFMSAAVTVQHEFATMLASWKNQEEETRALQAITEKNKDKRMEDAFDIKLKYVRKRLVKGYDPNLSRMSLLHSSKFLSTCSHWFLPFDTSHPLAQAMAMTQAGTENKALMKLIEISTDCDVDKFVTCELISSNQDLAHAISQQVFWAGGKNEPATPLKHPIKLNVQNLYRFFTNSPLASETFNPFNNFDLLIAQERYRPQGNTNKCKDCVEMLTEGEEYAAATKVLDSMIKQYGADERTLRLRGLCHEQSGEYADAIRCYTQATFLQEPNAWLLQHLCECSEKVGKYKEATTWMAKWLECTPDDRALALHLADHYLADGRHDEAQKLLYRLDYDDASDPQVALRIVRCQLLQGNAEAAAKYMPRLSESKECAMWNTMFLSAHIKFAQGQWAAAREFYTAAAHQYVRDMKSTYSGFLTEYAKEESLLLANGLTTTDVRLMHDALWMMLIHGE